jgi:hypothetical protein
MNNAALAVLQFFLDHVLAQRWLAGYRTYAAGASCILGGLVPIADMVASGHYDETKAGVAFAAFALGYKIIGDRGQKDNAPTTAPIAGIHVS